MISKLRTYPQTIAIAQDIANKINVLKREIAELAGRIARAERKKSHSRLERLIAVKEERVDVLEKLMGDFNEQALAVEKTLESNKNAFSPLELLIINKRYIEGLNWEDLMEQLHTSPEYARFRYERSTYMRAHKSALEKIIAMEEKE